MELRIAAYVFDTDRYFEVVTRSPDFFRRVTCHGKRVRHWQQIVSITSIHTAPAKMVGEPRRVGAFYQAFEPAEMCPVKLIGRAEIHRYPMLDDTVLF